MTNGSDSKYTRLMEQDKVSMTWSGSVPRTCSSAGIVCDTSNTLKISANTISGHYDGKQRTKTQIESKGNQGKSLRGRTFLMDISAAAMLRCDIYSSPVNDELVNMSLPYKGPGRLRPDGNGYGGAFR